jgi:hypothetical protein
MKTKFTFTKALLIIVISAISIAASAQAPAPPPGVTSSPGPTVSTNVPNGATPVDKFICVGAPVSLISTPVAAGVTRFLWWKQQSSTTGPWVLVGNNAAPTNTYTETTTTPGYYIYKVQTENSLGCESLISNPINVFALPAITATITPPLSVCQSITGIPAPFPLSVTPNDYGGTYTYTYQWFRDTGSGPIDIPSTTNPSAITPTLTGLTETTPGTVTYGVRISYATALGQATGVTCVVTKTTTVTVVAAPTTPTIQWN